MKDSDCSAISIHKKYRYTISCGYRKENTRRVSHVTITVREYIQAIRSSVMRVNLGSMDLVPMRYTVCAGHTQES